MILKTYRYQIHLLERGSSVARSSGEAIIHFNAVRLRVTGTGTLRMKMMSLNDVYEVDLTPLTIQTTTNREPTQLMNFSQQRARLELRTTDFGDFFDINRILVFAKPMFNSFPQ